MSGKESVCLFNIPNECTYAQHLGILVNFLYLLQQSCYDGIVNHCYDSGVHRSPCVAAIVGLAGLASASLHLLYHGEAAAVKVVKGVYYGILVCLVKSYKYTFHLIPFKSPAAVSCRGNSFLLLFLCAYELLIILVLVPVCFKFTLCLVALAAALDACSTEYAEHYRCVDERHYC